MLPLRFPSGAESLIRASIVLRGTSSSIQLSATDELHDAPPYHRIAPTPRRIAVVIGPPGLAAAESRPLEPTCPRSSWPKFSELSSPRSPASRRGGLAWHRWRVEVPAAGSSPALVRRDHRAQARKSAVTPAESAGRSVPGWHGLGVGPPLEDNEPRALVQPIVMLEPPGMPAPGERGVSLLMTSC